MPKNYKHLTMDERELIAKMHWEGKELSSGELMSISMVLFDGICKRVRISVRFQTSRLLR